jgi:hypothetical protein
MNICLEWDDSGLIFQYFDKSQLQFNPNFESKT